MQYTELIKGVTSSRIGFGCAPVLGSKDGKVSKNAIFYALDQGVNHFDLANSYGYGEAESFVGKLLVSQRKNLVYASKFGITTKASAKLFKPLKPLVRLVKGKIAADSLTSKPSGSSNVSDRFHSRVAIDPNNLKKFLHRSLKNLKTDYLDYYFIHEPPSSIENIAEILDLSLRLKKEGKIKALGLAFYKDQYHLHQDYSKDFDLLQFNNSAGSTDYEKSKKGFYTSKPAIFFSPMSQYSGSSKTKALITLKNDFPKSVFLCSMFSRTHIAENCKVFQ